MQKKINHNYLERIQRVNEYVFNHLHENLNLEKLAAIACLSEYHWHRVYRGYTGETIHSFIKRLRMEHAAKALIETSMPIDRIGRKAGFKDKNSFSRAFSASFQLPPLAYRKRGQLLLQRINQQEESPKMHKVTRTSLEPITLAAMSHKGNYMDIGKIYDKLFGWAVQNDYLNEKTRVIGIAYDDPNVVAEKDLRSEACLMIGQDFKEESGVKKITIPAGKYAVMEFIGPYAELHGAYAWFYGTWLKNNDVELAEHCGFEEYMNNARDTPPTELITHIHMPLK